MICFLVLLMVYNIFESIYILNYQCICFSLEGYKESTLYHAFAVYYGVKSGFYVYDHAFNWSVTYIWTLFQAVIGGCTLIKLICVA